MVRTIQRISLGVVAALFALALALSLTVNVRAQTPSTDGTVYIGDTEFSNSNPGTGSNEDIALDSCDVTLSFYGFPAKEQQATITFQNITGTPGSILENPQLPQLFTFTGSGDSSDLADEVTYGIKVSGPAVDGLGYHVYAMVVMRDNFTQTNNTKYLSFWVPESCETEPEPEPEEPPVVVPPSGGGQVASATTAKPAATAQPKSLPSTGSSDVTFAATILGAAGLIALVSSIRLWAYRYYAPKQ